MNSRTQHRQAADALLGALKVLYSGAPTIASSFELSSQAALDYCVARSHFSIIVPYTIDHQLLVERTFAVNDIRWSMIGGSLRPDKHEDFLTAASRLGAFTLPTIDLADIEPLAFLENQFSFEEQHCTHLGVAFIARIRNESVPTLLLNAERTRGHLIEPTTPLSAMAVAHNAAVFTEAQKYLNRKPKNIIPFHDFEIAQNIKYRHRYMFHDTVVKPIFRAASHFLVKHSIEDLERIINNLIYRENPETFIDVACGENALCAQLAREGKIRIVVGNDISFSQIELLRLRAAVTDPRCQLIYTNHDATDFPFADKTFGVAICKNVLHHMPDHETVRKLIRETLRIARRVIIVEVLDPQFESWWGKLRHRYYLDFLKDAAVHFYSQNEFNSVSSLGVVTDRTDIRTIRGIYQIAVLS